MSTPSHVRTRRSLGTGRTKSSKGVTTVGPETTRITPSMSAAGAESPSSHEDVSPTTAHVTGTPTPSSRTTTRRVIASRCRTFRERPAS